MLHEQLLFLKDNYFVHKEGLTWDGIPAPDEPFIPVWDEYIRDIPQHGVGEALSSRLVQLRFPVQEGMSTNADYRSATRRGLEVVCMEAAAGMNFEEPAGLKVYLHQTWAGRIPVMETSNRHDFENLVRVFSYRNEPVKIPASMGACMIKGYNNWDRVARYKKQCGEHFDFARMQAQKELYQDVFLILTDSGYSGIPAEMLGLTDEEWRRLSIIIRREHEATHYFTLRFLGSARNHLLDEFIADYMGIVAAAGRYRADWFLCFMGLENYPDYRPGGRLQNYLKNLEISEEAFNGLKSIIKDAAENIEKISARLDLQADKIKFEMLLKLSRSNLIELASADAETILANIKL